MKKTQKTIQTEKVLRKLMEDKQALGDYGKITNYINELAEELFNVGIYVIKQNDINGEFVKTVTSAFNLHTQKLIYRIEQV